MVRLHKWYLSQRQLSRSWKRTPCTIFGRASFNMQTTLHSVSCHNAVLPVRDRDIINQKRSRTFLNPFLNSDLTSQTSLPSSQRHSSNQRGWLYRSSWCIRWRVIGCHHIVSGRLLFSASHRWYFKALAALIAFSDAAPGRRCRARSSPIKLWLNCWWIFTTADLKS